MALVGGAGAAPAGSAYATEPPGVSGDTARPNYVGPSGNGLVERMKAGESPWNQGRSVKAAPVRFQKAVPRSKENAAVERREARRSALWAGNPVRRRERPCRKAGQRARRSAPANFGAPLPSDGDAKGSKPTIWTEASRDAPRGNAPARHNTCTEKKTTMPKICTHDLRHWP